MCTLLMRKSLGFAMALSRWKWVRFFRKLIKNKYKIANIMVRHAAHLYFPRSINRRTAERSLPLVLGPDSHVVAGPNRSSHLLLNLLFATSELLTFSQPYVDQVHLSFANKRYWWFSTVSLCIYRGYILRRSLRVSIVSHLTWSSSIGILRAPRE